MRRLVALCLTLCVAISGIAIHSPAEDKASETALTLIVMDPMAAPLACDCVKGYAQRKYEELGKFLTSQLGLHVNVVWAESLAAAMEKGRPDYWKALGCAVGCQRSSIGTKAAGPPD
jgi:hypothetical protein